jgi:hypothetical protein
MDKQSSFNRDNETYFFVGRPADYFYDFGMIPITKNTWDDILEKNRFLVALFEHFTTYDFSSSKILLPSELISDLEFYFSEYDSFDLSHWNLLKYETINEDSVNVDFPNLYMSEKQKNENHYCLNTYYDDIIKIFSKYSSSVNSCEKLLEYYLMNHSIN